MTVLFNSSRLSGDETARELVNTAWHEGEVAMQRHAGVADMMAPLAGRLVRDHLIEQHRSFYPKLPFVVAGVVDPRGDVWATLLVGAPGFLKSRDPLTLDVTAVVPSADPARAGLADGASIGLIGIELQTRRRNRLNGTIRWIDDATFEVGVVQSYGNCPQYIRQRDHHFVRNPTEPYDEPAQEFSRLDGRAAEIIAKAETLFVASYVDQPGVGRQVDASHRGGRAGFVHIDADGVLTVPDFAGNRQFNTLGNLTLNPRCGLVFVDFDNGDVLQITGEGEVALEGPEIAAFQGAERLFRVKPSRILLRAGALPLRWSSPAEGVSPTTLATGTWGEAAARLRTWEGGDAWRSFRIAEIVEESSVIRSLYLQPADGAGLIPHKAGQHLPIRVTLPGQQSATLRTYTLSTAAADGVYRLTVKREGQVSNFLHQLKPGDHIEARGPAGSFTIDAQAARPVILLAAGVGITPMIAMLRHLVHEGRRTGYARHAWLVYSARSKAERALNAEIISLASAAQDQVLVTRALSDPSSASPDDFEIAGQVSVDLLEGAGDLTEFDFYICGPAGYAQDLYDGLRARGVPDGQIFSEAFGPSALTRRSDGDPVAAAGPLVAEGPVDVVFAASGKRAQWTPADGTLLEFAEAQGLQPDSLCRSGLCGTCKRSLRGGAVAYDPKPDMTVGEDEVLICCAKPAAGEREVVLDL